MKDFSFIKYINMLQMLTLKNLNSTNKLGDPLIVQQKQSVK